MRTDALGRIILGTEESPVQTFLLNRGGRVEGCYRADTWADHIREAQLAALLVQDPDDEEGSTPPLRAGNGIRLEQMAPPMLAEAVLAADGATVLQAAVFDERPHFDFILEGPALQTTLPNGMLRWHAMAYAWMGSTPISAVEQNNVEGGMKRNGITLLDPTTFNKRGHRFL